MNAANTASMYKNQQIMTAAPEDLTLMLYNGAIRFLSESIQELTKGNLEKSHRANIRAQDIVREFMATLDMQYEIAHNLFVLYDYILYRLMQANVKKDASQLQEAKGLVTELRDAWVGAMKQTRLAKAVGK
ncbi:MAG: flagellar export chaperone FliS [Negativicutes bacterium]|nr:flagellar export chaperone FliS [Negativicutes bacterium]